MKKKPVIRAKFNMWGNWCIFVGNGPREYESASKFDAQVKFNEMVFTGAYRISDKSELQFEPFSFQPEMRDFQP